MQRNNTKECKFKEKIRKTIGKTKTYSSLNRQFAKSFTIFLSKYNPLVLLFESFFFFFLFEPLLPTSPLICRKTFGIYC